jgi:hypothetical protein
MEWCNQLPKDAERLFDEIRNGSGPQLLEAITYRSAGIPWRPRTLPQER